MMRNVTRYRSRLVEMTKEPFTLWMQIINESERIQLSQRQIIIIITLNAQWDNFSKYYVIYAEQANVVPWRCQKLLLPMAFKSLIFHAFCLHSLCWITISISWLESNHYDSKRKGIEQEEDMKLIIIIKKCESRRQSTYKIWRVITFTKNNVT